MLTLFHSILSLGGLNIALAMEKFPEKVAVGVFVTAIIPDIEHKPSYVLEKVCFSASSLVYFIKKFLYFFHPTQDAML